MGSDVDVCLHCGVDGSCYLDCVCAAKVEVFSGLVVIERWETLDEIWYGLGTLVEFWSMNDHGREFGRRMHY